MGLQFGHDTPANCELTATKSNINVITYAKVEEVIAHLFG